MAADHPLFRQLAALASPQLFLARRPWDEDRQRFRTAITVNEVRALTEFFHLTSPDGGWRVAIVDAADELNASAANALLKILEEPPPRAALLLVCHRPAGFLPTDTPPWSACIAGPRVFACCGDARRGEVVAIDAATGTTVGRCKVGNCPTSIAVTPDFRKAYVACSGNACVSVIDTSSVTEMTRIPVQVEPQKLAISPDGQRCMVTNKVSGTVSVIDTAAGVGSPTRARIEPRTLRQDRWWLYPLATFTVFSAFVVYATIRAFWSGAFYSKPYLSPFYSPELFGVSRATVYRAVDRAGRTTSGSSTR